ncbi:MAG: PRC-barrel domain-containing protein [Rhodoblastus sp.]|uniref:PRC-barrel domain-containing protein n=1 Tax=Rhodoblastus sp. TaxID=1962975 RepID=UPI003F9E7A7E
MRKAAYACVAAAMVVSSATLAQTPAPYQAAPQKAPPENDAGGAPPPQQMQQMKADSASGARRSQNAPADGKFAEVSSRDALISRAIGVNVYNPANEDIGAIKDIAFENGDIKAYIIGVGGFLGVGERYVAVQPTAITLTYNADDRKWRAGMDTDKDELKAAPEFRYPSTDH